MFGAAVSGCPMPNGPPPRRMQRRFGAEQSHCGCRPTHHLPLLQRNFLDQPQFQSVAQGLVCSRFQPVRFCPCCLCMITHAGNQGKRWTVPTWDSSRNVAWFNPRLTAPQAAIPMQATVSSFCKNSFSAAIGAHILALHCSALCVFLLLTTQYCARAPLSDGTSVMIFFPFA